MEKKDVVKKRNPENCMQNSAASLPHAPVSYTHLDVYKRQIPDEYVEHGNVDILKQEIGISTSAVLEKIEKELEAK